MAEVDLLLSSVVLVDKEGMALVKDKVVKDQVYIGRVKTNNMVCNIL